MNSYNVLVKQSHGNATKIEMVSSLMKIYSFHLSTFSLEEFRVSDIDKKNKKKRKFWPKTFPHPKQHV